MTSTVGWSAWVSTEAAAASRIRIALTFVLVLRTESSTRGDGVRVHRSSERLVVQPAQVLQESTAKAELLAPRQALRSLFWASPAPVASIDCLH